MFDVSSGSLISFWSSLTTMLREPQQTFRVPKLDPTKIDQGAIVVA